MVAAAGNGSNGSGAEASPRARAERLEHALWSMALPWLASGLAHDVKSPLNAMALHLAGATVRFERDAGPEAPDFAFVTEIVAASAADMGGRLAVHAGAEGARYVLSLPRGGAR